MSSDQRHGTVSVHVAYVMLVTVMMLWASGVIVAKSVAELVPPLLTMYLTAIGGMLVLLPFYVVESFTVQTFQWSAPVVAGLLFMALIPTMLATTMWNISVGVVGPGRASVFINLLPIFATLMAVGLLGEHLQLYHLVGGVLVCAGITLVVRLQPGRQNDDSGP